MNRKIMISAGSIPALVAGVMALDHGRRVLADRPTDLVGTSGIDTIRKNQEFARRSRGLGKRSARAAANDLTKVGQVTIVLGHIHPRWLRKTVELELDAGNPVTHAQIERWRAQGKALAVYGQQLATAFTPTLCPSDGRPCQDQVGPRCDTSLCGRHR